MSDPIRRRRDGCDLPSAALPDAPETGEARGHGPGVLSVAHGVLDGVEAGHLVAEGVHAGQSAMSTVFVPGAAHVAGGAMAGTAMDLVPVAGWAIAFCETGHAIATAETEGRERQLLEMAFRHGPVESSGPETADGEARRQDLARGVGAVLSGATREQIERMQAAPGTTRWFRQGVENAERVRRDDPDAFARAAER